MRSFVLFLVTAVAEILGCYAFYVVVRMGRSAWWLALGGLGLALFAWLLTLHPTQGAGRVYAAYGGVYIAASLVWLWAVEGRTPDRWDIIGCCVCLVGTGIILIPRQS